MPSPLFSDIIPRARELQKTQGIGYNQAVKLASAEYKKKKTDGRAYKAPPPSPAKPRRKTAPEPKRKGRATTFDEPLPEIPKRGRKMKAVPDSPPPVKRSRKMKAVSESPLPIRKQSRKKTVVEEEEEPVIQELKLVGKRKK